MINLHLLSFNGIPVACLDYRMSCPVAQPGGQGSEWLDLVAFGKVEDFFDNKISKAISNVSMMFSSSPNFGELLENEKSYTEQARNLIQAVLLACEIVSFFL